MPPLGPDDDDDNEDDQPPRRPSKCTRNGIQRKDTPGPSSSSIRPLNPCACPFAPSGVLPPPGLPTPPSSTARPSAGLTSTPARGRRPRRPENASPPLSTHSPLTPGDPLLLAHLFESNFLMLTNLERLIRTLGGLVQSNLPSGPRPQPGPPPRYSRRPPAPPSNHIPRPGHVRPHNRPIHRRRNEGTRRGDRRQTTHSSHGAAIHSARRQGHSHRHLTDGSRRIN